MSGAKCKWPSCGGSVEDGFCDTCGRPPLGATTAPSSSSRRRAARGNGAALAARPAPGPAATGLAGGDRRTAAAATVPIANGARVEPSAQRMAPPPVRSAVPPKPVPPPASFTVIEDPGASSFSEPGTINVTNRLRKKARQAPSTGNGYAAVNTGYAGRTAAKSSSTRRPRASTASQSSDSAGGSAGSGSGSRSGSRGRQRSGSGRGRSLGGGLVNMPVMPFLDPLQMVITDMQIHEKKCKCPSCKNKVNPDKRFCANCGQEYNFKPSLKVGDVVGGQYEIKGTLAFGGLGWIYLGMDLKLDRFVVLKGLLNSKDEAAAAAAVAERQFLAAVKHGKIVSIYNFVTWSAESYIVMEYVGGRNLKEIRKERGPLPPEEAVSYVLGILPALAFLHAQELVYCDFKPDNIMLEGDDVKLIDMGAVRRIGDVEGDIFGTVGYMAPEAGDDPTPSSDLYTVARALAVLLMDFDLTGEMEHRLPPKDEVMFVVPPAAFAAFGIEKPNKDNPTVFAAALAGGAELPSWLAFHSASLTFVGTAPPGIIGVTVEVTAVPPEGDKVTLPFTIRLPLLEHESLYRFLQKGTAQDPEARFQTADEMAAQLPGVLREIVAMKAPVLSAAESAEFMPERGGAGAQAGLLATAWRRLPALRIDREDPAAADILGALSIPDAAQRMAALKAAVKAHTNSAEARLRIADALIEENAQGWSEAVMSRLDEAIDIDRFDWRPDWYCGKLYLAAGNAAAAIECFDKVYSEIPGEAPPKLALAIALEMEGLLREAVDLYDRVSRTDPGLSEAAFGLARCRLALGDRNGAVEAYGRVPTASANHGEAQLAIVRALTGEASTEESLTRASQMLTAMERNDIARYEAEAALALAAVATLDRGWHAPPGLTFLGTPVRANALRQKAEAAFRNCARLADEAASRIAFVERANSVRPHTVV
jgi:serine/threonine-protein kinase PknG